MLQTHFSRKKHQKSVKIQNNATMHARNGRFETRKLEKCDKIRNNATMHARNERFGLMKEFQNITHQTTTTQ